MDIGNYQIMKAQGLISIAKIGDAFAISKKVFDTNTGKELSLIVEGISIEQLEKIKATFDNQIIEIIALIKSNCISYMWFFHNLIFFKFYKK